MFKIAEKKKLEKDERQQSKQRHIHEDSNVSRRKIPSVWNEIQGNGRNRGICGGIGTRIQKKIAYVRRYVIGPYCGRSKEAIKSERKECIGSSLSDNVI